MKLKYIKICLECGSIDVSSDFMTAAGTPSGKAGPLRHKCEKCNYLGILFPEIPKNKIQDFRKGIKAK